MLRSVSILNGPFGPLQRGAVFGGGGDMSRFNPQRAFRPVATAKIARPRPAEQGFNPQRAFRPVATLGRMPCLSYSSHSFNPQRAFRPVATYARNNT